MPHILNLLDEALFIAFYSYKFFRVDYFFLVILNSSEYFLSLSSGFCITQKL